MTQSKEMNFEASMEKLNGIVEKLEGGDLGLEESLKLYEEGIMLSQMCAKRLENVQSRMETLLRNTAGDLEAAEAESAEAAKTKSKKKTK